LLVSPTRMFARCCIFYLGGTLNRMLTAFTHQQGVSKLKTAHFLSVAFLSLAVFSSADGFTLISEAEKKAYSEAVENGDFLELEEKSLDLDDTAPKIELLRPDIDDGDLRSPLVFELRFEAYGDAAIDLETLKITYGWKNITKRIIKDAEVSETGILARDADIPPGRYSIQVQIRDSKKRLSKRKFKFTVKK